jgi:2-oxoglutarate ferredoxin oxidoreductase subunit alpha
MLIVNNNYTCLFGGKAGYPMTPGSSVLTDLVDYGTDSGLVFKQAEDEIAAINMLIGATSGGGFALMVDCCPSTGLPHGTAQADLNFVVNASQGGSWVHFKR